jgi:two-component system chemotaxis response regulator CheB
MLIAGLPPDLQAAVFVVVHIPAWHRSELPQILNRRSSLSVSHPAPNQGIEAGHVYVAPPDHHMLLRDSRIELWRGPKEDRHRPSINALFRSAAVEWRERAMGAILSGALDDGVAGLYWIKKYGGITIVQDPTTATAPSMPVAALQHVNADFVLAPTAMGPLLGNLIGTSTSSDKLRGQRFA